MKKILYSCLGALALLLVGCVQELQPNAERGLELVVFSDEAVETKAEEGSDTYLREALLTTVDIFLYPGTGEQVDRTKKAELHFRRSSGQVRTDSFLLNISPQAIARLFKSQYDYKATVLVIANYPGVISESKTSINEVEALRVTADFAASADHRQNDFLMHGIGEIRSGPDEQDDDPICTGTVKLKRYASKMTVALHVEESVTMDTYEVWHPMMEGVEIYLVDGVNSVYLGGPDLTQTSYFSYEKNRFRFVTKDKQTGNLEPTYYTVVDNEKTYYLAYPMNMYPQHWIPGATESPNKEPYLKLIVPWHRDEVDIDGGTNPAIHVSPTQKQCYYKITMPPSFEQQFKENHSYHLAIDVKILGALTDENPLEIPCTSYVVYWQDRDVVVKQADVGKARYLAVDQNHWDLHNVNTLSIPFLTSHSAIIENIRVTRPYFGNVAGNKDDLGGTVKVAEAGDIYPQGSKYLNYNLAQRQDKNGGEDWLKVGGGVVEFRHDLINNYMLTNFDYSPYTISFTLRHSDRNDYSEEITIKQYPAIYISRVRNSDPTIIETQNANSDLADTQYYGYVFVDGAYQYIVTDESSDAGYFIFRPGERQARPLRKYLKPDAVRTDGRYDRYYKLGTTEEKKEYQWRACRYTGGSVDMYNIHITVLPTDFDFVLGDPRLSVVDNLDYHYVPKSTATYLTEERKGFSEASALYGVPRRSLQYYYPTENSSRTQNMLAPSYRICSKMGGVEYESGITKKNAEYRCATYQEDGFPAGRWRLPTRAEVAFIAQLSANELFTLLFNRGGYYWSANGRVQITQDNRVVDANGKDDALLRCVYDTWYWGEDQQEYDAWRKREYPTSDPNELRNKFVWGDRPR